MKFKNFLNFLSGCICKIIWQFSIFKTIQYILIEEGSLIKWILEVWIELEIFQDSHSGHFTNYLFIYWYVQNSKIKLIVSERISTAIPTINWKVHLPKSNIWRGKWVQKLCNHYIMSKANCFLKNYIWYLQILEKELHFWILPQYILPKLSKLFSLRHSVHVFLYLFFIISKTWKETIILKNLLVHLRAI